MSLHLMLLLLSVKEPKVHEIFTILPAPQISCPINLEEYARGFKSYLRKDIIEHQFNMAQESRRQLIRGQI